MGYTSLKAMMQTSQSKGHSCRRVIEPIDGSVLFTLYQYNSTCTSTYPSDSECASMKYCGIHNTVIVLVTMF